jgi:hypothetical protein
MGLARELSQGSRRGAPKMRPVFARLHTAALSPATSTERLTAAIEAADAFPERRRLSEGAVYVAALRRYQLLTGHEYQRAAVTAP